MPIAALSRDRRSLVEHAGSIGGPVRPLQRAGDPRPRVMTVDLRTSWCARWAFERGLAAIYLVACLVAVNQFVPLVGQHGLLPAARFVEQVPMRLSPSIFF
jgi:hypothetical protein